MRKKFTIALFVLALTSLTLQAQLAPRFDPVTAYANIDRSPEGLNAYRAKVVELHNQLTRSRADSVLSTITFKEPIQYNDLRSIIEIHDVATEFYYAFAEDEHGNIVTIGGEIVPELEEHLLNVSKDNDANLLGIVSVVANVPVAELNSMQGDKRVFLVDVSADHRFARNPRNEKHAHHLAWDIYKSTKNKPQ